MVNKLLIILSLFTCLNCISEQKPEFLVLKQDLFYDSSKNEDKTYNVKLISSIIYLNKTGKEQILKNIGIDTLLLKTQNSSYYLIMEDSVKNKVVRSKSKIEIPFYSNYFKKSEGINNDIIKNEILNSKIFYGQQEISRDSLFIVDEIVKVYVKRTFIDERGDTIQVFGH